MPDALPSSSTAVPTARAWTRAVAVASLLGLIVLGLAWELWLAPTGRGTLALKVLPLLLALPGLLRSRLYTYRWLSLLVWIYFTEGMVRATSDHGIASVLGVVEVLLCLLLFAACAAYVRLRLANRVEAPGAPVVQAPPVSRSTTSPAR